MKIRTDIHAGLDSLAQCQKERDYWKGQAEKMELIAKSPTTKPPAIVQPQLPVPVVVQPQPVSNPTGGWVGGAYYYDRSGWCG